MTLSTSVDLLRSSDKHHLMLLYDDEDERSNAEIGCINRALTDGQYCVYATVDANDSEFAARLASRIKDLEKHTREGNFVLINFKPFYDSAASGQLTPFRQLKAEVEATLKNRISSGRSAKALLVADAACNMSRHKQFDECVTLEEWWQDTYNEWMAKNMDITIICAHPSSVLKKESHLNDKGRISHVHSLTLDLNDFTRKAAEPRMLRILIAEPEADIRAMYRRYFKSLPVKVEPVETATECLEHLAESDKDSTYDLVIIDTHTKDASGIDIAERILAEKKAQDVIITSTWEHKAVLSSLKARSSGMERCAVLQKPFRFSQLLGMIKPAKKMNN